MRVIEPFIFKQAAIAALIFLAASLLFLSATAQNKIDLKADAKVISELENNNEARVIVILKSAESKGRLNAATISEAASKEALQKKVISAIPANEFKLKHKFSSISGFSGKISRDGLQKLKNNPDVEGVYLDQLRQIDLDGSTPLINASMDWALVYNNSNITGDGEAVCIIDTGVNYSHPDMGGCSTATFLNGTCSKVPSGYDYVNTDNDPADDQGHGTHVAGIVASTNSTYKGVAPGAMIIALKACFPDGASASCYDSDVTASIDWCVSNYTRFNISVISMSLGGGSYQAHCDSSEPYYRNSINSAIAKNISVTISTGNSGSATKISAPACVANATAVASSTKADAISSFSNRNNITDLIAPGSSITSLNYQGTTTTMSGTSMAAPQVAGAFALISQYKRATANITLTPSEIQDALNRTGKNINDSGGNGVTYKRISLYDALISLDAAAPNITFISQTPENNSALSASRITVNISANKTLSAALLEWNGTTNYSMSQQSNTIFYISRGNLTNGNITFRVYANNTAGNFGASPLRTLQINNSAPNITSYSPSSLSPSITEPNSQSFNITYNDTNNDAATITWYVNSSNQTSYFNLTTFNFTGNYTSAGSYNITAVIDDSSLTNFTSWTLNVSNTNRAPQWNFTLQNQTLQEDTNITFNITAYDPDGDNVTYFINDSRLTLNRTNGTINYMPAYNFNGIISLNATASDSTLNLSEIIFVNVTPVNDAPVITIIENMTINETDWANITISASDIDSTELNYSINYSMFSQLSSGNFSWKTNTSSSGVYSFIVNVTDGSLTANMTFNLTVIERSDYDSDGIPDIYDTDDDNDGIPDTEDYMLGTNYTFINTSRNIDASSINISVNSSTNMSQRFNDTMLVNITNGSMSLIEFFWNFTNSTLYLNFTIDVEPPNSTFGAILVRSLSLQQNRTKNISMLAVNSTISTVCLKDADADSIANISTSCNSQNETLISCPGANSSYSCILANNTLNKTYFKISGLRFSAAKQQCPDTDADSYYASGCGNGTDCDDIRANVYPGAPEVCNDNLDNNCNGQTDENCGGGSSSGGGSSGGGGGGGGGGSAAKPTPKASHYFSQLNPEARYSMKVSNPSIPFTNITFSSRTAIKSFTLTVEPANLSQIEQIEAQMDAQAQLKTGEVYQYINITPSAAIGDSELYSAKIDFKVNKTWIAEKGINKDAILLSRLKSGSWQELPTSRTGETETAHTYTSESQGFSTFAISTTQPTTPQPTTLKQPNAETPDTGNLSANTPNATGSTETTGSTKATGSTASAENYAGNETAATEANETRNNSKPHKPQPKETAGIASSTWSALAAFIIIIALAIAALAARIKPKRKV